MTAPWRVEYQPVAVSAPRVIRPLDAAELSTRAWTANRNRTNRRVVVTGARRYRDGWVRGSLATSVVILVAGTLLGLLLAVAFGGG